MDVEQLMRIYPQLDRLMAETLLGLSKQEKLQKYLDEEKMAEQPSYYELVLSPSRMQINNSCT